MKKTDLIDGKVCFIVMFDDVELSVPVVQTLIYESRTTLSNGTHLYIFRELKPNGEISKFSVADEHADELLLDGRDLVAKLSAAFTNG